MIDIKQALMEASSFLRRRKIVSPREEAELLLAFLLNKNRLYLYAHGEEELPPGLWKELLALLQRRSSGEPLAYITGEKEFMGLPFRVNSNVLIPRPETEHLVENVLKWARCLFPAHKDGESLQILDLGTGCGNIAVSLAYYLPRSFVIGVDISPKALEIALFNAKKIGVSNRVTFLYGNYWETLSPANGRFHAVVSNPPYIPGKEIPLLAPEVQKEPLSALDGGADGLDAYRKIFKRVKDYLHSPGFLALEIGRGQTGAVLDLAYNSGFKKSAEVIKDYAGIERVLLFST